MRTPTNQDGITLLVTLLLMGVLLGVSASLLNLTLKQFQLSGIAYASETAFQAASAGMECALYHDLPKTGESPFEVPNNGNEQATPASVACMGASAFTNDIGDGKATSGEQQRFRFSWGATGYSVCTEFSVYKFYDVSSAVSLMVDGVNMDIDRDGVAGVDPCPQGSECTIIQSRGYNVACGDIAGGGRVVEREYTRIY